jgi:hypothetical protein
MPTLEMAKIWHRDVMFGLEVPNRAYVGQFRGIGAMKTAVARVSGTVAATGAAVFFFGTPPNKVGIELKEFEQKLIICATNLDAQFAIGDPLSDDGIGAILDLAAWAHSEWVRIHPFANGNGRIARILANFVLIRYGLPPVVVLRPRPDGEYANASASAMAGDWKPMSVVFRDLLERELASGP